MLTERERGMLLGGALVIAGTAITYYAVKKSFEEQNIHLVAEIDNDSINDEEHSSSNRALKALTNAIKAQKRQIGKINKKMDAIEAKIINEEFDDEDDDGDDLEEDKD